MLKETQPRRRKINYNCKWQPKPCKRGFAYWCHGFTCTVPLIIRKTLTFNVNSVWESYINKIVSSLGSHLLSINGEVKCVPWFHFEWLKSPIIRWIYFYFCKIQMIMYMLNFTFTILACHRELRAKLDFCIRGGGYLLLGDTTWLKLEVPTE
jgi:hypothetical protein